MINNNNNNNTYTWVAIFILSVFAAIFSQLSLFLPTLPLIKKLPLILTILISIVFLLIQWVFIIPFIKIGITVMNPIQLVIFVFIITFIID